MDRETRETFYNPESGKHYNVPSGELDKGREVVISLHELICLTDLAKGYITTGSNAEYVPQDAQEAVEKFWNLAGEFLSKYDR
jgi:hypothetical protein